MAVSGGKASSISKGGAGKTKTSRKGPKAPKKAFGGDKGVSKTTKKNASRTKSLKGGKIPS